MLLFILASLQILLLPLLCSASIPPGVHRPPADFGKHFELLRPRNNSQGQIKRIRWTGGKQTVPPVATAPTTAWQHQKPSTTVPATSDFSTVATVQQHQSTITAPATVKKVPPKPVIRIRKLGQSSNTNNNDGMRERMPNWGEVYENVAEQQQQVARDEQGAIADGFDYDGGTTTIGGEMPENGTNPITEVPSKNPTMTMAPLVVYNNKKGQMGPKRRTMAPGPVTDAGGWGMERIVGVETTGPSSNKQRGGGGGGGDEDPLQMTWENCRKMDSYARMFGVPDPRAWVRANCFFLQLYVHASCADIDTFVASCAKHQQQGQPMMMRGTPGGG